MDRNIKTTLMEAFKAVSIASFVFCGVLTLIVVFYFWKANGTYEALALFIFGTLGFYQFIKLIYNLNKLSKRAE